MIQELGVGGAERVVASLAAGLEARGHAVAVAAGRPAGREVRPPDLELPFVGRRVSRLVPAALAVRRATASFQPDVVHAHNPTMAALVAVATRRGSVVPALVTVHGLGDGDLRRAGWLLRAAGLPVVACGPGVAASLAEHGVTVCRTVVNGVTPPPPPASRQAVMAAAGLDPGLGLVVCTGRLAPVKNQQLLLRALVELPGAGLLLVGGGPLHEELRSLSRSLGVAGRAVLCGDRADARELIGAADVVALPSRSEGLPLAALEAMAAGRPLVATAVRGVRELVTDGINGLLVPPDDHVAMAAALRRVLGDGDLAARLGAAGEQLAGRCTVDRMVSGYEELYRSVQRR